MAFLFSDVAGSTRLLSQLGAGAYADVLTSYRDVVETAVTAEGGRVVDREGDGLFLVLPTAAGALRAAAAAQRGLGSISWPTGADVAVRMGVHAGEAHAYDGGYVGLDIHRAARVGALARGGQILVSEAARLLAGDDLDEDLHLRDLGEHELKGLEHPERIHQLIAPGLRDDLPAPPAFPATSGERLDETRSLAILPFQVVGGGEEAELLAAGLHNDLLTELSKVPELSVISRTSVIGYRDTDLPIPQIARKLNAGTVIEGAVQSAGRRIRLSVQVIDGINDVHRWAETYDRELTTEGLFDIQSELAAQIVESLPAELTAGRAAAAGAPVTADLEAYRHAARGRQQQNLKTEDGFLRAIELFEHAIEIDREYADAWIGLADTLINMEEYGYGDRGELLGRAETAVERALELAPASAGAHSSLALLHITRQDGPAAVRELERAIRLQPSYADAHNWHAWVSLILGRGDVGLESARRAVELDPLSAEPVSNLALSFLATGRPEEALVEARRAQELSPFTSADLLAGLALYDLGRLDGAREALEPLASVTAGELTVPWAEHGPDVALALTLVAMGASDEARAILDTIERTRHPFATGLILLGLGEREPALAQFARVEGTSAWTNLAVHHHFRDVWSTITGTEQHRALVHEVHRSWNVAPPGWV